MTTALSPQVQQGLEQLRDIRLPGEVAWWPLAPGWWIVIGIAFAAALLATFWLQQRRRSLRQRALNELADICEDRELMSNPPRLAEMLGGLLKRVILQQPQYRDHAAASGERWRAFLLDQSVGGLDEQVANFLTIGPYAALPVDGAQPPAEAILDAVANWIRRNT